MVVDRTEDGTKVFCLACELGMALGWENISLEPGCREYQIDANWWMAINPHRAACVSSKGASVPGLGIWFEWNGWPAGVVSPGGGLMACGSAANVDTLIAAIKAAIERVGQPCS